MLASAPALLVSLLLAVPPAPGPAGPLPLPVDTAVLQRLLEAEDARGTGPGGLAPLLAPLDGNDTLLRRVAVRGLGRLQRPELGRALLRFLGDTVPAVRAEAANAIAQSLRRVPRDASPGESTGLGTAEAAEAFAVALSREPDPVVVDALGQSLGRLPLADSTAARAAEHAIRARLAQRATPGLVHGLYTLARARRATGNLTPESLALLRRAAVESRDTMVRRLALRALAAAGGLDSATAVHTARDPDDESRRMTLRGSGTLSLPLRAGLVRRALGDHATIVRVEAVAAARLGNGAPDCGPILRALRDREPYVALTAVDSLGSGCAEPGPAIAALRRLAGSRGRTGPADHRWQMGGHALLALARLDSAGARALLPRAAAAERWEVRLYAARAAAAAGDRTILLRLAADADRNVQEAGIAGLAATAGREADSVYLDALNSTGNQVILAAAEALKGSAASAALPRLLEAFDRLSAGRTENARDPRLALLARIGELGSAAAAPRLRAYLTDYDTTVAAAVATTIAGWTGEPLQARPAPLPIRPEPLAGTFLARNVGLRVTLASASGGGSFTIRLFSDEAPATVARVLRLAREGFYDGKVFQRVEPNFVIQGGGPDANEYVGDASFMRDELTLRMHARGTVGISARGRDTGDGQWFLNLVDNPLLDHEFTLFGRLDGGQAVAERMLEGDRIARVEIVELAVDRSRLTRP